MNKGFEKMSIIFTILGSNKYIFSSQELKTLLSKEYNKDYIKVIIKKMKNLGLIVKIAPNTYLTTLNKVSDYYQLANQVDRTSYVSLYSILGGKIIKQSINSIQSITGNPKQPDIENLLWYNMNQSYKSLNYYYSSIPQTFGIYYDSNGNRVADLERAFLDLIYFVSLGKMSVYSELYTDMLNQDKINEYIQYYPKSVKKFLDKNLNKYVMR